MPTKPKKLPSKMIVPIAVPVNITAAMPDPEMPDKKMCATFDVIAYTGGAMQINGWDLPVVIDLAGLETRNSLVANLDHESSQRVGNVTQMRKTMNTLEMSGITSAVTAARDEVVDSAANGFVWQASVEVQPKEVTEVAAGKTVQVNGQKFTGPLYVTKKGTLRGFAFVSHGADDNTSVTIAATADSKEKNMTPELKSFIEDMLPGTDIEALSAESITRLQDNYEGRNGKAAAKVVSFSEAIDAKEADLKRIHEIESAALKMIDAREKAYDERAIYGIRKLTEKAISGGWTVDAFRLKAYEETLCEPRGVDSGGVRGLPQRVLEAAICQNGRLSGHEQQYTDQELQMAHDKFKHGIGLKQLFCLAASANGHPTKFDVDIDVQRAAFGLRNDRMIQAEGFSTISLPNVFSNVANKFLKEGWEAVDMTPMRIAATRSVRDFKQTTTVSLTGGNMFKQIGPDGELKHGDIGELSYNNQAYTYGILFAITRTDIINDDLGALTAVPRRIGRGGALKLNDLFWTVFLNNTSFFTSGNKNVSTGAGSALGLAGLTAAEVLFLNQTDPDGYPVGVQPSILLVPPTLKATALTLMNSQLTITGANTTIPNGNIWNGRYRVESSPYMENSSYTGYGTAYWYLLADPGTMPVIEIAALNGRVEPVVDTAAAEFNTLGVQMRGYCDVGVAFFEKRGGVRSAGT